MTESKYQFIIRAFWGLQKLYPEHNCVSFV